MISIAILGSGKGTNFEAIADAVSARKLGAKIVAVLSDREDAPILDKARARGLPALHVPVPPPLPKIPDKAPETADQRRGAHESLILEALAPHGAHFLVLAGYMRVLSPTLIEAMRSERGYSRIVNVHPSLLPSFRGIAGYQQAYEYGAHVAGVTVHLVEHEVDAGPICAQEAFKIHDCKAPEEVRARGLAVEHRLFPETLRWVLPEQFSFERSTQRVRPN